MRSYGHIETSQCEGLTCTTYIAPTSFVSRGTTRLCRRGRNLGVFWKHSILDQRTYYTICIVFDVPVSFDNRIYICILVSPDLVVQGRYLLLPSTNLLHHPLHLTRHLLSGARSSTMQLLVTYVDHVDIQDVLKMEFLRLCRLRKGGT